MARPLKQWLYKHRDNPYPTKTEKILLALGSQMTLVQVSALVWTRAASRLIIILIMIIKTWCWMSERSKGVHGLFMSVIGEGEIWFLWFTVFLSRSEKLDFNLHLQLGRLGWKSVFTSWTVYFTALAQWWIVNSTFLWNATVGSCVRSFVISLQREACVHKYDLRLCTVSVGLWRGPFLNYVPFIKKLFSAISTLVKLHIQLKTNFLF